MAGSRDVQFLELKDTINQLNTTIRNQNDLIASLNKRLEEQAAKEEGYALGKILRSPIDGLLSLAY